MRGSRTAGQREGGGKRAHRKHFPELGLGYAFENLYEIKNQTQKDYIV